MEKTRKNTMTIVFIVSALVVSLAIVWGLFNGDGDKGSDEAKEATTVAERKPGEMYQNCKQASEDGVKNLKEGDEGYNPILDYNNDGVACDLGDRAKEKLFGEEDGTNLDALKNITELSAEGCFYGTDEIEEKAMDTTMSTGEGFVIGKSIIKTDVAGFSYLAAEVEAETGNGVAVWGLVGDVEKDPMIVTIDETSKRLTTFPNFSEEMGGKPAYDTALSCLERSTEGETELDQRMQKKEELENSK